MTTTTLWPTGWRLALPQQPHRGRIESAMRTPRKPHNDYAGYVFERKIRHNTGGGGHIVVIDKKSCDSVEGLDTSHRWVVLFEFKHSDCRIHSFKSLKETRREVYAAAADADYHLWELVLSV